MDGGIMETALIGAAMGGGSSLITGGDPLKGALMGGLMGGVGSGIGGLLGSGAAPAAAATEAATGAGVNAAAQMGANTGIESLTGGLNPAASNFGAQGLGLPPSASFNPMQVPSAIPAAAPIPATGVPGTNYLDVPGANFNTNQALAGSTPRLGSGMAGNMGIANAPVNTLSPSLAPQTGLTSGTGAEELGINSLRLGSSTLPPVSSVPPAPAPVPSTKESSFLQSLGKEWKDLPTSKKLLYGGAGALGLTALMTPKGTGYTPEKYTGPLSHYQFDPAAYKASEPSSDRYRAYAAGGIADLGGYSDGGRMLKGPGDGMSDSIPASIADKQPARLATEEFVIPADVVSHLGNGSSDAGAKQLYAMMHRVRKARTGNPKQGREINAGKLLPA